ncbi:MAG: hypothetical protein JW810_10295 [Sedimentisphaerales bacterium]|nr:hypothetical protein [Sedimentisphaerales bacterium]
MKYLLKSIVLCMAFLGIPSGAACRGQSFNAAFAAANPSPVREIPHPCQGVQILLDDYLIEESDNLVRQVNRPRRDGDIPNPLVRAEEDRCFQPFFSVLRDAVTGRFRIWYGRSCDDQRTDRSHIGYLESPDGIHWIRPHVVLDDPATIQFGSEVLDEGPNFVDPEQRYKYGWWFEGGLRIAVSSDGLHFKPLVDRVVLEHNHDINNLSWDPLRKRYAAIISRYTTDPEWEGRRRVTQQSFSEDLLGWEEPWYVLRPDKQKDEGVTQFYGISGFLTRGPLRIGMVKILRDDLKADAPPLIDPKAYGIGYTALAWTHDGRHWWRDPEVFFDRNPEPQTWDRAHAWIDEQLIVGDQVYLYYAGYRQGHKMNRFRERQIGLVKMPLDRYVARRALAGKTARLLTIPLAVRRPRGLVVNADASGGTIRVQVRDAQDTVVAGLGFDDGAEIRADGIRLPVVWKNPQETQRKLAPLEAKVIKLEFELTDAALFAFEFTDAN